MSEIATRIPAKLDVATLVKILEGVEVDQVIKYADLTAAINGLDVRGPGKGRLDMARQKLLAAGRVFVPVRGEGLRRASHEETATKEGKRDVKKTYNAARRAVEKQLTVDLNAVSPEAKTQSLLVQSAMGTVMLAASNSSQQLLKPTVERKQAQLNPAEVGLALFEKK